MFSHASSSQRENSNVIFIIEKLEKSDKLVNAISNFTINDAGYELNTATASDAQGDITSDPDTFTQTSNVILDQNLLSCRTIGEVSILSPPTNPSIVTIILSPQTLLMPVVKEIFSDTTSGNAFTNRTLQKISRTGVDRYIPITTPIHSETSKYSTPSSSDNSETRINVITVTSKPDSSDIIGTRIPIGTSDTTTSPPCGLNVIPNIDNIWQSATSDLKTSNKLDASNYGNFPDNMVALPIFTDVLSDKLSNRSIRGLYARVGVHLAADPVQNQTPQFVNFGLSTVDALDKGAGLWTPATRFGRPMDVDHMVTEPNRDGKNRVVGDAVRENSDYNYKTYLEIWKENQ